MAAIQWKCRHFMRDGTEIKSGKDIPMTPQVMEVIQRAFEVCEMHLERLRKEGKLKSEEVQRNEF